ncbi:YegS/Rv2252/BmrU family lipid kinase [Bombilactobacillus bombi]|nr:YegS/Rv2252/BmrU family lipid kinase [Bombilactobacillus bombi]
MEKNMNKYPSFTIIINQHAASGRSRHSLKVVTKYLNKHNINYRICTTPGNGAQDLVCELLNNQELNDSIPLVMGGDGTLNQAINGVKYSNYPQTALAYIPAGSGNDFANGLKLPQHHEIEILQRIITAVIPKNVNLGKANLNGKTYFFINNIGIGLDAKMVHFANQSTLKTVFNHLHLSKLIYLSQINKGLKQKPFNVDITIGQQHLVFDQIIACIVTNHPFIGSGVPILPTANPYENNLDIIMSKQLSPLQVANLAYKIFTNGEHLQSPLIHHYQLHRFDLQTSPQQYGQMDGEDLGKKNFNLHFSTTNQQFWL